MSEGASRFAVTSGWLLHAAKWALPLVVVAVLVYGVRFAPLSVDAFAVGRGTVVAEVMGTGTLEARISVTISPKIAGRIARVLVDQGDQVAQGAPLVLLDDDELRQQVAIAEANTEAARAAIVRLTADKERASAVFEQAKRHYARTETLSGRMAIAVEEFERAAESLAIANSDIARAEAAITEGQKNLVAAEKTLEYHQARLKDTRINAPFDGIVVSRQREAGDVAVPGSAVLTLISTETLWISAWVDETEIDRLAEGQAARVVFRSQPDHNFSGQVVRLGMQADRETREFIVDVQVAELPSNWAVGQRAEVYIEVARRHDVLFVEAAAIVRGAAGEGVFVVEKGYALWRPLTLGLRGRDVVEVVDGLEGSEVVVVPVERTASLNDGRRVRMP